MQDSQEGIVKNRLQELIIFWHWMVMREESVVH